MRANIKTMEDLKVAGMLIKVDSKEGKTDIPKRWIEFMKILGETENMENFKECFGYSKNYMEEEGRVTFDYLISIKASDYREIPEGFAEDVIPGGKYAVYTYKGKLSPERVEEFYGNIYCKWLIEDDLSSGKNECFEYYDERFKEGSDESEFDVWVPVM